MPRMCRGGRGFTMIELGAVVAALSAGACLTLVGKLQPESRKDEPKVSGDPEVIKAQKEKKARADQIKDSTQVRGIHQGFVLFAQNNKDQFPLPSVIDAANATVKGTAADKDTTANIMSIFIYNGFFGPELCISPVETSGKIKADEDYAYVNPAKAAKPEQALWDPAFSADFSDGNIGNTSYAHLIPSKSRHALWSTKNFDKTLPVIANRGPKVTGVKYQGEGDKLKAVCETSGQSKTFTMYGAPDTWEGNVAYNDNHVNFETDMNVSFRVFRDGKEKAFPDVMFFNEENDASDTNAFLGVFTHAGASTRNFKSIWD